MRSGQTLLTANLINAWALEALTWANAEGLITGVTATTIVPQGNAIRAQAATILARFLGFEASEPPPVPKDIDLADMVGAELADVKHLFGDLAEYYGDDDLGVYSFYSGIALATFEDVIIAILIFYCHPDDILPGCPCFTFNVAGVDGSFTRTQVVALLGVPDEVIEADLDEYYYILMYFFIVDDLVLTFVFDDDDLVVIASAEFYLLGAAPASVDTTAVLNPLFMDAFSRR